MTTVDFVPDPPEPGDGGHGAGHGTATQTVESSDVGPLAVEVVDDRAEFTGDGVEVVDDAEADGPLALPYEKLRPAIEAILMVVDEPVPDVVLAQILERPRDEIQVALRTLAEEYTHQNRGFALRDVAGGWRFYTREDYAPYVERFVLDGQQTRLTQAALETLAVVAYKQPVTRSKVSAVRGVNCDGVIRTLLTRGLIAECGTEPESGAHLYQTTSLFLEKLGLSSVEELPPIAPLLPDTDTLDDVIDGH